MDQTNNIKLVGIDLDGTLLRSDRSISATDLETLMKLGKERIIRVAATGRSLFKVKEVLPQHTPIDYVVFSSGEGIYDWHKEQLLQSEHFTKETIVELCKHLLADRLNFVVFKSIPNNNKFYYHQGAGACNEFENYLERHKGNHQPLSEGFIPEDSGHFMVIIPNNDELFGSLKTEILSACPDVKVIRATSPINDQYLWLEIFPNTVSKGHGLKWLCDYLNIDPKQTMGIGNDYNDLDMFEFVAHPYVLGNGVESLRQQFNTVNETNEENGVTAIIQEKVILKIEN
jgi:Cof subfamily protein (haloacid dehalogenase superfamily)